MANVTIQFTNEDLSAGATIPTIHGPVTMRVEWSNGRVTERRCRSIAEAYDVVGGEAPPFERWTITAELRSASELYLQLLKYAQSDMRRARKEGSILIAQTRRGTVELSYHASARRYEVREQRAEAARVSDSLFIGSASEVIDRIAELYQVSFR